MSATGHQTKSLGLNPDLDLHRTQSFDKMENKWIEFWNFFKEYFEIDQKRADLLRYIKENPMRSTVIIVTLVMVAIPVMCFLMFVVGSVIFTLLGFLLFEGSILAIGMIVLAFTVLIAGSIGLGLSLSLIGGYKGIQMTGHVWKQGQDILMSIPIIRNLISPSSKTD